MNKKLFLLDENMTCIKVLDNDVPQGLPYFDDLHTEKLEHGFRTFEFTIPADHEDSALFIAERFIIYPNMDNQLELFTIKEINESNKGGQYIKKVSCENTAVSNLLGSIVRPAVLNSTNIENALKVALANTEWEIGQAEYSGFKDIELKDYRTSLKAVHDILDAFGAEIEFLVEFDGVKVTKKKINARIQRGHEAKVRFEYGRSLAGVERLEDSQDLVTALIGLGKGDSQGSELTLKSYTGSVASGYEKKADWIGNLDALNRYGKNGRHIFGVFKDNDATNAVELYERTLEKLKALSKPRLTYQVDLINLERLTGYETHRVRIGDTIAIKDSTFKPELMLEARVIELKRSKTDPTRDRVMLGEYVQTFSNYADKLNDLQNTINRYENKWNQGSDLTFSTITDPYFEHGKTFYSDYYTGKEVPPLTSDSTRIEMGGIAGNHILSITGHDWIYGKNAIPIDVNRTYKMTIRVRQTVPSEKGNTKLYAGVATLDNDYQNISGGRGFHRYCGSYAEILSVEQGWITFTGTITGVGDRHSQFRQGTTYVRPVFIVDNVNPDGEKEYDGVVQIDMVEFRDVTVSIGNQYNLVNDKLDSFEIYPEGPLNVYRSNTVDYHHIYRSEYAKYGDKRFRLRGTDTENYVLLAPNENVFPIPLMSGKSYILSAYGKNLNDDKPADFRIGVVTNDESRTKFNSEIKSILPEDGWVRTHVYFTVPSDTNGAVVKLETGSAGLSIYFDGLMLEEVQDNQTAPTSWRPSDQTNVQSSANGSLEVYGYGNEDPIHRIDANGADFTNLTAAKISSPSVVGRNMEDFTLYVAPNHSDIASDVNVGTSREFPLLSLKEALSRIPQYNEGGVRIVIMDDTGEWTEGMVTLSGILGDGKIIIDFRSQNNIMYGSLQFRHCKNDIYVINGTIKNTEDMLDEDGVPQKVWGGVIGAVSCTYVSIKGMLIDAGQNTLLQYCFVVMQGNFGRAIDCELYNGSYAQIAASSGSRVEVQNCYGRGGFYGIYAHGPSVVGGEGYAPSGPHGTVLLKSGAVCNVTFTTSPPDAPPPTPPTPKPTTYAYTWNATSTKSWRTTYGWRTDNHYIYQGQYGGWGNHKGLAFFNYADIQSKLEGKTIKSVSLYLSRRSGGANAAQSVHVYTHSLTSASGTPEGEIAKINAGSIAVGRSARLTLPKTTGDKFKDGSAKGILLYASSGSPYAIFNPNCKLKIVCEG
ncbi:phage tail protein [Hazenella sp. IB182353]|uniref:phage tail spike protein n=1 Tax=Polycladospora coralii TaxID=2771432 RepID=UPI0017478394|nr:phage tail spike protein [Polycladospora coralii]MBS7531378.1 phage tail protein [Polycladospora coralii]